MLWEGRGREGGRHARLEVLFHIRQKHAKKFFQKNKIIIINKFFNDFVANMLLHLWQMWCCALIKILFFRNVFRTKSVLIYIYSFMLYKVHGKCGVVHPSVRWATQKATPPPPPPPPPLQSSASLAPPPLLFKRVPFATQPRFYSANN